MDGAERFPPGKGALRGARTPPSLETPCRWSTATEADLDQVVASILALDPRAFQNDLTVVRAVLWRRLSAAAFALSLFLGLGAEWTAHRHTRRASRHFVAHRTAHPSGPLDRADVLLALDAEPTSGAAAAPTANAASRLGLKLRPRLESDVVASTVSAYPSVPLQKPRQRRSPPTKTHSPAHFERPVLRATFLDAETSISRQEP